MPLDSTKNALKWLFPQYREEVFGAGDCLQLPAITPAYSCLRRKGTDPTAAQVRNRILTLLTCVIKL